jgi:hypothetical protein
VDLRDRAGVRVGPEPEAFHAGVGFVLILDRAGADCAMGLPLFPVVYAGERAVIDLGTRSQ